MTVKPIAPARGIVTAPVHVTLRRARHGSAVRAKTQVG
jgi:hypothetical protein